MTGTQYIQTLAVSFKHMRLLLIPFLIMTIRCSTKSEQTDKPFQELSQGKKTDFFRGFGDELTGDFLTYSGVPTVKNSTGQNILDTTIFVELVLDSDKRFAVRHRFIEKEVKTDSMTFFMQGGLSNKGIGKWSDLGDKLELKFQLGTVDSFFDKNDNKDNIKIIDNYTLQLDKTADQLWILKTLCKK
jgi:hypothetical protein